MSLVRLVVRYFCRITDYPIMNSTIDFVKYQGTGNDFIIIDDRNEQIQRNQTDLIQKCCDRKFGIGADGLILLRNHPDHDFEMVYFNADGRESSMCGNGGRCIVAFAKRLGIIREKAIFIAIDGLHEARITGENVELKMTDVREIEQGENFYCIHTGSPHYIKFVNNIKEIDIYSEGKNIRNSPRFKAEGINVNFVEVTKNGIEVATYERGVEDETLSCGTGVTAAALAHYLQNGYSVGFSIPIKTKGGNLEVRFQPKGEGFTDVWLCGPAVAVFEGKIDTTHF